MRFLLATLVLSLSFAVNAELLIVVGVESPIESLSSKQVASIFLAKPIIWTKLVGLHL
jgi:hypothetical protein